MSNHLDKPRPTGQGLITDQRTKEALRTALVDTAALAAEVGLVTLADDLSRTRIPKLDSEEFHLVVLGEFNHGKSTFVNALLGAPVLPVGITPTTATINHLVWSETPRATAVLTDGTRAAIDPTRLSEWVTIEGKEVVSHAGHIRHVEVGWPAEILRDRLTLVDTPGVNDINEQRAEIAYGYIPRADACLFLLDGAQVLKQSERLFLEQRILRRSKDKLIFVVGKMDLLAPDEREEALRFCRTNLARIVEDPVLFPVSAKRWLKGDREGSGMQELITHLGNYFARERGRVLLDNGVGDGLRTVSYVRSHLGIRRRSLSLALDELEARIAKVRSELSARHATLRAMHETIRAESQAIAASARLDVEEFTRAFVEALPAEIERADGADIKKHLPGFLQDTWKNFAESEGEKLAALLEKLADQIIQVTNENVQAAMATLAAELGPAETHVELDVDTLKYDVGIFALGALGTGIFLFVNSLVGGMLTLAAPILAVVFRERAAAEVKVQARARAVEVVERAGAQVTARFSGIVDEFASQLADFVNTAGETLHRGISEVLDRALADRRAQGADAAAADRLIVAQLGRLVAIERRLEELREGLWGIFDRIANQLGDLIAPDDVRLHVERGAEQLETGDLDGAVAALSQALLRAPDHSRAACLLGVALARKGELDGAEQAFEQALAVRPDLAEARLGLADVLRRKGRGEAALDAFRRALDAGISDPNLLGLVYRGRGAIHLSAGRPIRALRELRKAAAQLPADGEVNRLLGGALAARGDLDGARICLEKAEAAEGALPPARRAAGRALSADVYRRLGRRAEAEARLASAFSVHPSSVLAHLSAARLHLDGGEAEGAMREAGAALSAAEALPHPGIPATLEVELHRTRARAEALGGDAAAALRSFDAAITLCRALRAPGAAAVTDAVVDGEIATKDSGAGGARAPEPTDAPLRDPLVDAALGLGDTPLEDDAARAARLGSLLDEALHLALATDRDAAPWAEALLSLAPGGAAEAPRSARVADALAGLAIFRLSRGDAAAAEALSARALLVDTVETRLAAARVSLGAGRAAQAAAHLRLASLRAPTDPRPRALLARVYGLEREPAPRDLEALLGAAHRQLQRAPETSDLAPEAARVVEILDRPLLLTVMGEFNAGKSTFVNALVGEEVAPMGITPTTATINVLKYGAERGGRVVYRDDTVRRVAWADVPGLLRALDEAEAARIRYVEVLYPLETLQRVNIVDTPGLNSIRPEHEATARGFIAQADAVIWLFSCRQPGTASEKEALLKVHAEGKKALGVVNMIDLAEDAEARGEVLSHLQASFGELVEALVPFSARDALLGRDDPERLLRSNRAELGRVLEERFYARAKAIQRDVAARRLAALLAVARERAEGLLASDVREEVEAARAAESRLVSDFEHGFLDGERQRLVEQLADLYAQAGREVLDFVKPRRWAFGANEAQKADRDFVVALVEQQLASLAEGSRARVAQATEEGARGLGRVAEREAEGLVAEELRVLDEQVYGRYRAFARGFLRGGRVDEFFTRVLPRLELGEQAIQRALLRDMPALEVLDEELVAPLRGWTARFFENLDARLGRLLRADELSRFELEERLLVPLSVLSAALAELAPAALVPPTAPATTAPTAPTTPTPPPSHAPPVPDV